MTRSERELIIQRYLSGEMSSTEEGDFFIQVALDRELRHDLQAQQMVESAFRKDREAERSGHTALRTRVASMLAASVPIQQPAPEQAPATPAPTATSPTTVVPAPPAMSPVASIPAAIGSIAGPAITPLGWGALAASAVTAVAVVVLWNPFGAPETRSVAPVPDTGSTLRGPAAASRSFDPPAATPGNGVSRPSQAPAAAMQPSTTAPESRKSPTTVAVPASGRTAARNGEISAKKRIPAPSFIDTEEVPESTKADGKKDDKLDVGLRVRITPKK